MSRVSRKLRVPKHIRAQRTPVPQNERLYQLILGNLSNAIHHVKKFSVTSAENKEARNEIVEDLIAIRTEIVEIHQEEVAWKETQEEQAPDPSWAEEPPQ